MRLRIYPVAVVLWIATAILHIPASARPEQSDSEAPQSTDSEERLYSLLGHGSVVELRTFQWIGEDQLIIRFSFQTRSYQGQLLRLIATREDRQSVLEIKASISKRTLRIHAEDFVDSTDKTSTVHFPDADVSDGQYHQLSITIDPKGDVLAELDGASRAGKIGLEKPAAALDATLYIGGTPEAASADAHSIIGCLGKISIGYGPIQVALVEVKRSGDVGDGCLDACKGSGCAEKHPSGCLNNYSETICDCVGTNKEGAFCDQEPKVYHFDGGQYFAYELGHHEHERQPRRLHVSFKSEPSEDPVLLLYAPLASDGKKEGEDALAVIVNRDSIEIRLRGVTLLKTPSRHELINARWHEVTLEINYPKTELTLKLDNERFTSTEWSNTDAEVSFHAVYFGGYKTEDVGKGFRGCLRTAYVGHTAINDLIAAENPRLTFGKRPIDGSCPLADFEEATEEPPSSPTEASTMPETQEDEQTTVQETEEPTTTAPSEVDQQPEPVLTILPVYLDDHQRPSTTGQPLVTCADLKCQHGTQCVEGHSGSAHCECRGSGYVGKLCQFSNLPKTCDELFESGENRDGVFRIDPDGSGPVDPVLVKCEMDGQEGSTTYVDHNFVNGTYVRQNQKKDVIYSVVYRNMSGQALKALSSNSEKCEQYVRFECSEAPIMLHNSTWFRSAQRQESFSAVGGAVNDKHCPCGRQRSCGTSKCSCNVGDKQTRSDEGYNVGDLAGITEMTFLQNPSSQGWAKVALGPMQCRGSNGTKDVIQFRRSQALLKFPAWKGRYLSFWFRTTIKNARLFSQPSNNGRFLNLDMEEGHTLTFYLNLRKGQTADVAVVTRLVSQSPINDAVWHRIKIETVGNQIRFSIDDRVDAFYTLSPDDSLDESSFDQEFMIGGTEDASVIGYVGCVRQLILNDAVVRLSTDNLPDGIVAGCQSHCSTGDRCFHNAECIEDYENDGFRCKCVNEYTYRGEYCQIDINKGSEISIHNAANAFVSVRDFTIDPVANHRLVFSFRTDQPSGLLLFAHDDKYNMVQIHLVDGNRISLTVNYEKELRQCTIVKKGIDFNNMQWYQIVVKYSPDHTALFVDKDMCQIDGGRRLSTEYLEEWDGDISKLRVVYPPRSPVPPSQMPTYSLLYVGGVKRQPRLRIPRQSRQIVYTSPLPNLLGCIRGFTVGNQQVDLRTANKTGNVKDGCDVGCDRGEIKCEHDGYCTVDWASDQQRSTCDCVPTSYFGSHCALDHGLHFDGNSSVLVQLELMLQRVRLPEERSYDSLSFAFSTAPSESGSSVSQLLAHAQVNSEKDLRIFLTPDGHLTLESRDPAFHGTSGTDGHKPFMHAFGGKFNDGQRHFVFLKFFGDKLVAKVDRRYHETNMVKWRLSDVRAVSFGGASNLDGEFVNYRGCMSNALIDFRSSVPHSFKPFDDLLSPRGSWHENYQKFIPAGARLEAAQCAQYTVEHPMPTDGPATALPPFTEPMQTLPYVSTATPPSAKDGGKGSGLGIAIGLAVVVIVVLLCIALYLYYVKCVKPKRRRRSQYQQPPGNNPPVQPLNPEKELFLPSPDDPQHRIGAYGPRNAPTLTELPEANEDLDDRSNRGSVHAGRPPISASPPPPYAPTATPPLSPASHAAAKDSLQPAENFPPAPTDEELKAMSPTVRRNPSTKRGAFVYGFPNVDYVDASPGSTNSPAPSSPRSSKPPLAPRPSVPRRMPVDVPIPKI